jgi:diguanylate cyclase (GGDEF)-like protein
MATWQRWLGVQPDRDVPTDIRISLIDALFTDRRSLFIGSVAASASALITAWRTGAPSILLCAAAMIAVACLRALDMNNFIRQRAGLSSADVAKYWERRYVAGAATFVGLLGTWCLLAFVETTDPFVRLISFSLTLAYMIGISGRNFASAPLVMAQIICAGVPLTVALLLVGDVYYAVFAFVLLPFFTALKFISDRLRKVLLDSLISSRNAAALARRFNTALDNMPHGLCMFDANHRLVVSNKRMMECVDIPYSLPGEISFPRLLQIFANAKTADEDQLRALQEAFDRSIFGRAGKQVVVNALHGRILAFTFQPMENGGAVMLVEDVTEQHDAEVKIRLARYDSLTNLPNRAFFRESVVSAATEMGAGETCALLFLDLDEFKRVNDTLGHTCGDKLLCAVSDRLRRTTREADIVARLAGDEFVIFQPRVQGTETVSLARRIVETVGVPYEIDGHQLTVSASIGIATAPGGAVDIDKLLRDADIALYRSKSDGGSAWRFFEPEMDSLAHARRNLEIDLRNALSNGEFQLYYQPLIDLRTQRISTCEALLRWRHPTRGLLTPEEFLPVAEDMGLIVELGNWVLRRACDDCAKWPAGIRVAVNLSPIELRRADVAGAIRAALSESGLPSRRLEVDITESALVPDTKAIRLRLDQIRGLGVGISLDDFGTGYSSLSCLQRFPLNKIKIDRSFLGEIEGDPRSLSLLRGLARLAADLGMTVTVEGVETDRQLALLVAEPSIDEAQGFLFSPPMGEQDMRALLEVVRKVPASAERVA